MTVPAGFSERVFEFAFNAEFAARHSAILAACPSIPTQQQEKALGYDVEFKLKAKGRVRRSLFLQHKVARFVGTRVGSNSWRFDSCGGPYFVFQLDSLQYNRILQLRNVRKHDIYYCAPRFVTRENLDKHYAGRSVNSESVWLDVAGVPKIVDAKAHAIVYSASTGKAYRNSTEMLPVEVVPVPQERTSSESGEFARGFDTDEGVSLYDDLWTSIVSVELVGDGDFSSDSVKIKRQLPPRRQISDRRSAIHAIQELAVEYLGASWLLEIEQ